MYGMGGAYNTVKKKRPPKRAKLDQNINRLIKTYIFTICGPVLN